MITRIVMPLALAFTMLSAACTEQPVQQTAKKLPSFSASVGNLKAAPREPLLEDGVATGPAPAPDPEPFQPQVTEQLKVFCYSSGMDGSGIPPSNGRIISRIELAAQLVTETLEHGRATGETAVIVDKRALRLHLVQAGEVTASYYIELGGNPVDDKRMEGDLCTPEGIYHTKDKRDVGETQFYRGFLLDYPNADDRRDFRAWKSAGQLPEGADIGGGIMLHGLGSGKSPAEGGVNWTHGCVALSDEDMDAVFPHLDVGNWVTIVCESGL